MFLISTVLGFLSGLGIGGGSLLILYLTIVLGQSQEAARAMNLLFFIPSALIASLFHIHQGSVNLKDILPGILAGCLTAALSSLASGFLDTRLLRKLLGGLLIVTGIRELFYRERKFR